MLARGARADARDAEGRTAAQFARQCAERQRGLVHASEAADLLDTAHAAAIERGRVVRVTRQGLVAGLAVLRDQPGGMQIVSSAGVPRGSNATTNFVATGVSSGPWLEVSPPGAQLRGWLRCSDLKST